MNITTKTDAEIKVMVEGGKRLVEVLRRIKAHIKPGTLLSSLEDVAIKACKDLDGKPSFLGYKDYPAASCISVNHGIVHCVPDSYELKEGDIISVDFGFFYQGLHTDATISWIVGKDIYNKMPLLKATYSALMAGTSAVVADVKVGDISQAIENALDTANFTIMRQFVGHGIGKELHESPVVPNFVGHDKDTVLPKGATIAIEPIAGTGTEDHFVSDDGWSVYTLDKQPVAHFEQTILVTDQGSQILTPIQEILDFTS
ncbi:MAG: type I methionyl aminopeptidase [Patescibacteria group bacterium]|nr:type I methionyl aminopeptidase [Patescibacteria group bacterium]